MTGCESLLVEEKWRRSPCQFAPQPPRTGSRVYSSVAPLRQVAETARRQTLPLHGAKEAPPRQEKQPNQQREEAPLGRRAFAIRESRAGKPPALCGFA